MNSNDPRPTEADLQAQLLDALAAAGHPATMDRGHLLFTADGASVPVAIDTGSTRARARSIPSAALSASALLRWSPRLGRAGWCRRGRPPPPPPTKINAWFAEQHATAIAYRESLAARVIVLRAELETAEASIVELDRMIHGSSKARNRADSVPLSQWERLMASLATSHHRFLAFVKKHGNPTLEEVVEGLGLKSKNSVGGTTRAIDIHTGRCGYHVGEVFHRDVKGVRPNKVTRYIAGPALQANEIPEAS